MHDQHMIQMPYYRRSWWQKCTDGSNVLQQCTQWHCPCLGVQQVPSLYTAYRLHSWCRSKFRPIFAATLIGLQLHPDILGVKLPQPPKLSTVTAGNNFQLKFESYGKCARLESLGCRQRTHLEMIFLTPESSARSLIDRGSIVSWCWWRLERARSNDGAVTRGMGQPPTWRLARDLIELCPIISHKRCILETWWSSC